MDQQNKLNELVSEYFDGIREDVTNGLKLSEIKAAFLKAHNAVAALQGEVKPRKRGPNKPKVAPSA